eukprot:scaffold68098_cov36-Phaeocystis_antarctica.AAC.1
MTCTSCQSSWTPTSTRYAARGSNQGRADPTQPVQGSNQGRADRVPGRSATHTFEPRLGQIIASPQPLTDDHCQYFLYQVRVRVRVRVRANVRLGLGLGVDDHCQYFLYQ